MDGVREDGRGDEDEGPDSAGEEVVVVEEAAPGVAHDVLAEGEASAGELGRRGVAG